MTQLDTKPTEQNGDKRSPMMWLVAAAAVIVIGVALILTGSADILRRHTEREKQHDPEQSDLLTKLFPIAFVATGALWLVVILITDFPAWTLVVYVAVAIPVIQRLSRSDKNDQPN